MRNAEIKALPPSRKRFAHPTLTLLRRCTPLDAGRTEKTV